MPGSLNELLPDPISKENEEILLDLVQRKMKGAAGLAVRLLHAMEERFGPEAREVVRELIRNREPTPRPDAGEPEADLREFCAGDEPAIRSCNPRLAFKRTKVLMNGDEVCDHVFYVKKG